MPQLFHDDTFRRLCRGRDFLATEYQSPVLLEQAAREACLSEFHFDRLFRATFGETPHGFLTRLRMHRARQMLASERSVTEVCLEIGYGSLGSSSSKFRAQFGRSPAEFQREVRRIFGYSGPWRVLRVTIRLEVSLLDHRTHIPALAQQTSASHTSFFAKGGKSSFGPFDHSGCVVTLRE